VKPNENVGQDETNQENLGQAEVKQENVGQETTDEKKEDVQIDGAEATTTSADALPTEVIEGQPAAENAAPVEGVSAENAEQQPIQADADAKTEGIEKGEASDQEAVEEESEYESDSDFDIMEEIDPSYEIDTSKWKTIKDFDEVDLKPEKKDDPEKGEKPEKRKKADEEEEADVEEESHGVVIYVRSEKERDEEFRNYVRDLCRPQIISYLPDRNAPKGSNVKLTCTVKGYNMTVRWLKNGEELQRSKTIQTKSDGEIHMLEITKITNKDAGEYTVVFKNRAGEVSTSSLIKVFDGKLHKPDHLDIALVKGEFLSCVISILYFQKNFLVTESIENFINFVISNRIKI
jgi:hypothetical protein